MSNNILDSNNFGDKLYRRFPRKYQEDDVEQNYALKRYLQALADGGFKYSIDDVNGLLDLIDYTTTPKEVLQYLFAQYGLEIFNGIPEEYLRYLLPNLGEAWLKKGSTSVIDFIASVITGTISTSEIVMDEDENPSIRVSVDMGDKLSTYFPDNEQFKRLLEKFIPFYCDSTVVYTYSIEEHMNLFFGQFLRVSYDITPVDYTVDPDPTGDFTVLVYEDETTWVTDDRQRIMI